MNESPSILLALADAAIVLAAILIGWAVTVLVLRGAKLPEATVKPKEGEDEFILETPEPKAEVPRGGTLVGLLERAAVATCVVAGHVELIAVVVAVKGLGRFAELRDDPAFAERFLIGTLTSMLSAVWVALFGVWAIDFWL